MCELINSVVVPARAGMSLRDEACVRCRFGGPRASGDEPILEVIDSATGEWSPRERG